MHRIWNYMASVELDRVIVALVDGTPRVIGGEHDDGRPVTYGFPTLAQLIWSAAIGEERAGHLVLDGPVEVRAAVPGRGATHPRRIQGAETLHI